MLRVFIGVDPRQPVAYHVLSSSIMRRSSKPVAITPLILTTLPIKRRGLTDFTYARYLVPYLCGYHGKAVFLDSDMLLLGDIAELFEYSAAPVSVVPFAEKFAFEMPSVMVFDCSACEKLTPEFIDNDHNHPQSFGWADRVGVIPPQWNFLVGYSDESMHDVKLVHYTQGVPGYKECRDTIYAKEWFDEREAMLSSVSWLEIMGTSVHAPHVLKRLQKSAGA